MPSSHAPASGEQTLNYKEHKYIKTFISIYSKPDSEQHFRIVLLKGSIHVTLWNSWYCKGPKNSTLPTSLPQCSAPCEWHPKNPKRNARSFSPHSGSVVAPCPISVTSPSQALNRCTGAKHTQPWYSFLVYRIIISPPLPPPYRNFNQMNPGGYYLL